MFRFDDNALVTPHLARLVGHDSPLLHLKRYGAGGMSDRFAEHAEELWAGAVPVSGRHPGPVHGRARGTPAARRPRRTLHT
ncbi:hypothetical protein GCM10010211_35260 [Streptomyces albospinus]|uniref:Uncharacterized protein n=1 Tax=Streptomyces albospinus TaxID=285515 RepID=A0ABQ2V384_9ACTN|nr:hypothetical protein GCM10010211_35260 [Streptomyces albospinus]